MSDMLSQEEIDVLLKGSSYEKTEEKIQKSKEQKNENHLEEKNLSEEERDALGEIGNISMGTAATTLFTLLGQKVTITTPKVSVLTMKELGEQYPIPFVVIQVKYKEGLEGINLLVLKEDDVKIMTDLMMGGDGRNVSGELTELHLSAISEAMNQMVGSASTSLSEMFGRKIDIYPPSAFSMNFSESIPEFESLKSDEKVVKIAFNMVVGDVIVDSEIMQIIPIDFAKEMVESLLQDHIVQSPADDDNKKHEVLPESQPVQAKPPVQDDYPSHQSEAQASYHGDKSIIREREQTNDTRTVKVEPVQFQTFDESYSADERRNIDLIRDVPLEITVELGRTTKRISEILEFTSGTVLELDKLAGESLDILVNGHFMAKGEVVIIDENYGIRITDILSTNKKMTKFK